ncbi:hypothetical protein BsWGS_03587 [Bradybaena similaris]
MSDINTSIMADLEWDEGLSMPVANAENKELETQIQKKQTSTVSVQNQLQETEGRVRSMTEHLKNLQQELQNMQGLACAREKEIQTEYHLLKLTEREGGRLKQEVGHLMKEMDCLKEKRNSFEKSILKKSQMLEELQSQMNWDVNTLDAWFVESSMRDEDAMTLQKYTRQDEVKIKTLTHCREKLIAEALQKKYQLDLEVTNTVASQIELDKIAENFRNAHLEREELLLQWENTIELMKRRDRDMDQLAIKLAEVKQEVCRQNNIMCHKQQYLQREQENNVETEKKISAAERLSMYTRKQLAEAEQQKLLFESEMESLRRTLDRIVLDLEMAQAAIAHVKKEIAEKQIKLQQATATRVALDEKLKATIKSTLAVGQQATQMEDMLMEEEKRQESLLRDLIKLETMLCKSQSDLNDIKAEEKIIDAAINCAINTGKNFASKIQRLDMETLKQQEILYNQSLNIMQLEKRCYRMQGEQTSEEKSILESKVHELQQDLELKNKNHIALMAQLKRVQESQRRVEQEIAKCIKEKADLLTKIDDCTLHNTSCEKELKNLITEKQNLMVTESLLKLEIKKIQDLLNSKTDNIVSLEMRKMQLDTTMRERHQEIKIHQEMLHAKIKITEEERQQVSTELYNKLSRIDTLEMRFKFLVIPMMPPDTTEEKSQVYCLIKATEEKEMLQREGDNLDASIRKAEKEILALENTLNLMNGRNDLYQQSFRKVTESSDEMNVKRDLNEQMKIVMDKYRYKKRQIQELQDELVETSAALETLTKTENDVFSEVEDKKNIYLKLKKEIIEQYEKLGRAGKQNARIVRDLRSAQKVTEELPEEKDINVRELRELNKDVMKMITDSVRSLPEVFEAVQLYFTEADLPSSASRGSSLLGSKQGSALCVTVSSPDGGDKCCSRNIDQNRK